eukprot:scaffold576_cov146-Chaetoceros_neogracile.AAC.11
MEVPCHCGITNQFSVPGICGEYDLDAEEPADSAFVDCVIQYSLFSFLSTNDVLDVLTSYLLSDQIKVSPDECGVVPQQVTLEYWNCFENFLDKFPFMDHQIAQNIDSFIDLYPDFDRDGNEKLCQIQYGFPYQPDPYPNMDYWDCLVDLLNAASIFLPKQPLEFGPPSEFLFFNAFLKETKMEIPAACVEIEYGVFYVRPEWMGCIVRSVLPPIKDLDDNPSPPDYLPPPEHLPPGQNETIAIDLIFPDKIEESRSTSITQIVTASISFISSVAIISMIHRSYVGLSSTFHRLLLGLSIADILSSFWLMLSTLLSPTYTSGYVWNPRGNINSCDAQGFFLFLGIMGAPLYNCSLCFYYLAIVKFNKKDTFIREKIEPYLHAVPILVSLTGAFTILAKKSFNANVSYCWINEEYPYCGVQSYDGIELDVPCERGKDAKILFSIFAVFPYAIFPAVIVATMACMYREVVKNEKKLSKYGVGALRKNLGNNQMKRPQSQSNDASGASDSKNIVSRLKASWVNLWASGRATRSNNTKKQSRAILHKAMAYSLAYLLTYMFTFVTSVQYWAGYQTSSTLKILVGILFPLQGFFNFLVFIQPKVANIKRTKKLSWLQSFVTALKSRGDKRKRGRKGGFRSGKKSKIKKAMATSHARRRKGRKRSDCSEEEEKVEIENPLSQTRRTAQEGSETYSSILRSQGTVTSIGSRTSSGMQPTTSTDKAAAASSISTDDHSRNISFTRSLSDEELQESLSLRKSESSDSHEGMKLNIKENEAVLMDVHDESKERMCNAELEVLEEPLCPSSSESSDVQKGLQLGLGIKMIDIDDESHYQGLPVDVRDKTKEEKCNVDLRDEIDIEKGFSKIVQDE